MSTSIIGAAIALGTLVAAQTISSPAQALEGYLGGHLGAAFGDLSSGNIGGAPITSDSDSSLAGGGIAGALQRFDQYFLGIEGDFGIFDLNYHGDRISTGMVAGALDSSQDWYATIRARAGISMDNFDIFLTGGVAFSELDAIYTGAAVPITFTDSENLTGYTIGGGIEGNLDALIPGLEQSRLRLEYLYMDFGSQGLFQGTPAVTTVDVQNHIVRGALIFTFPVN